MPKSKVRKRKNGTKVQYEERFIVDWDAAERFVEQVKSGEIETGFTPEELDELTSEIDFAKNRKQMHESEVDLDSVTEDHPLINPSFLKN